MAMNKLKIQLDDILFIEAAGNYTKIHLQADRLLSTRDYNKRYAIIATG